MSKPLEYDFKDGSHVKFDKYTIDTSGIIINNITGEVLSVHKSGSYNRCRVYDNSKKSRMIRVCRAIASTFIGRPWTTKHTVDHKDRDSTNDTLGNIRWLCNSGQQYNRNMSETNKSSFIFVKDGTEKTAKEWIEYLKDQKNHFGREYTMKMINYYAVKKHYGFSFKKYLNLPDEVWKRILSSDNKRGYWDISNMNRIKYVTKHAENVLSGDRICLNGSGYPVIGINGKQWLCHILSFMTFFPKEYAAKKPEEIILHKNDDKLDFRPHMLRIGTNSENMIDAHDNGCHDGTKTARMKCASYVNGEFEKEYISQMDAERYLKSIGFEKASFTNISKALEAYRDGRVVKRYKRTWKVVTH